MQFDEIKEIVENIVDKEELLLVDFTLAQAGRRMAIRILLDRYGRVTVSECAGVAAKVREALNDNILYTNENYMLEVSSPGIGRELSSDVDWKRSVDRYLRITLDDDTVYGKLIEYTGNMLYLDNDIRIPVSEIRKAVELLEEDYNNRETESVR